MWNCVFYYYYYYIISVIIVILIPLCKYLRSRVFHEYSINPSALAKRLSLSRLVMKIEEELVLPIRQPCDFFISLFSCSLNTVYIYGRILGKI